MNISVLSSIIYVLEVKCLNKKGRLAYHIHSLFKEVKNDPTIVVSVNRQMMCCNFNHKLAIYQKQFVKYDRQLPIICRTLRDNYKRKISVVDVGANVGDTVLNIGDKGFLYLLIEGNKDYNQFINWNLKKYDYVLENCYLSDSVDDNYKMNSHDGTGSLVEISDDTKDNIAITTLDDLIARKYESIKIDLLKIDTDGFDFKVLRGSKNTLSKFKPLIFFEWDKLFLNNQSEDELSIFPYLRELGYNKMLMFDNFGNFLETIETNNMDKLKCIINNTRSEDKPYYYDVLALHNEDDHLEEIITKQLL